MRRYFWRSSEGASARTRFSRSSASNFLLSCAKIGCSIVGKCTANQVCPYACIVTKLWKCTHSWARPCVAARCVPKPFGIIAARDTRKSCKGSLASLSLYADLAACSTQNAMIGRRSVVASASAATASSASRTRGRRPTSSAPAIAPPVARPIPAWMRRRGLTGLRAPRGRSARRARAVLPSRRLPPGPGPFSPAGIPPRSAARPVHRPRSARN